MKSTNRARVVQELADLFYRSEPVHDPATLVGMAYEKLQQAISYPQAGFFGFDSQSMELKPVWETGTPSQITHDYLSHYYQFDPFVMTSACLKSPNRAIRFSDFTDINKAYHTEMADILIRANYHYCIATVPFINGIPTAVVSLRRSKRGGEFNHDETQLFEWFSNHLVLGLERHALMRKLHSSPPAICCFAIPTGRFYWRATVSLIGSIVCPLNKSYCCRARRRRDEWCMRLDKVG
jgi:hypothetical protein